ncbi:MAG: HAD family hydrolase [Betaproteobacteria bacterium]|nr:HAD family hydrolase [Betaproteobacteria bacterium]
MELALFDLDNTLLAGDSDYEWAQYLIERGVVDRGEYEARNDEFFRQYKAGTLDIAAFLEMQLAPLARYGRSQLDAWHREFMQRRILPIVLPRARALVDSHRARGHICAILTSTNAFIVGPIAREFGIEHLLATDLETSVGPGGTRYTGRPRGVPCFREGKVTRLEQWLSGRGETLASYGASWFYSDSLNDMPLLERVTHPVAVDPDDTLRREAAARGWQIIDLA